MKQLILASQSPRRKELLTLMGVDFDTVPSEFNEHLDDSRTPEEVAVELALGKAEDVARKYPGSYVIGSDTIVTIDGSQLGKPLNDDEARDMLRRLAGKAHAVTTGVVVINLSKKVKLTGADTTLVYFKAYDHDAVEKYIATGDWRDKAGSYGIQSGAASLIDRIEGQYDTVIGLPTHLLVRFLNTSGIQANAVDLPLPF